jgi:aldehyde dehydrogenase (NAD+)
MNNMSQIITNQRKFFFENRTKDISFRKEQLLKLKKLLTENEKKLCDALFEDFRKSAFSTYATELGFIHKELKLALRNLKKWAQPEHVTTNLLNFPGSSYIIPEPYGNCLIISPWNFPYQLTFIPLISAMAAGNTVVIKPSEYTPCSSSTMVELINKNFPENYIYIAEGGAEIATDLLNERFDKIFFTGSTAVGKIVMTAAAKHLTPVTLELGGKSPVIVMPDANLSIAVRRIVLGKFLNAGQTCIAPDYVLVHTSVKDRLLQLLKEAVIELFGEHAEESEAYCRIVNKRHFDRLTGLIENEKIYYGGHVNQTNLFISPTLLQHLQFTDKIMEEEIFGPILPVLEFTNLDEAIGQIKMMPRPLSLYVFSGSSKNWNKVIHEISFGNGAINDTVLQFANPNLPFGGVGYSGMGSYHGTDGFRTFSHQKSILKQQTWFDPFIKYPPYSRLKKMLLKFVIKA